MSEALSETLHRLHIEAQTQQAQAIRDCPNLDDRMEQARRMIRAIMYDFALSKISMDERRKLFGILHFAWEPCHICPDEPIHTFQDEEVEDAVDDSPKRQLLLPFDP